jgi:nitrogen regulatory protein PII
MRAELNNNILEAGEEMTISKISAIVQPDRVEAIEQRLLEINVQNYSCFEIKGRGHYANLYNKDGMTQHTCIELFISTARAKEVAEEIMDVAHTGVAGDGIISIEKIDSLYKIETKSLCEET